MKQYAITEKTKDISLLDEELCSDELVSIDRKELNETIRLHQGMIFKFKEIAGQFIHTLCDGELVYRLGLTPSHVVGKQLIGFLPEQITKRKHLLYERAWNGEDHVTYEAELNGIHYFAALRPVIRNGEVIEVIGSCMDITDRKKVEKALLESENKYRLIAENMTDLIILFDRQGKCIYASPSHETVLGYPPEYFLSQNTLHLIHPNDTSLIINGFEEVNKTKIPLRVEFRLLHAEHGWKLFDCTATPVLDEDGEVEHIMVVAKDITEKRRAEELLWKSEKLSLVGELAAGVAHEIRNPLTSIKGFIQLFQQGVRNEEYFNVILSEFNRIEDIIKEFLSLAKPQEIQLKSVSIPSLLKEINTLMKPEAYLKNVQIIIDSDVSIPLVMCDANQIKQVLLNLCKNSIEATDGYKRGLLIISAHIEDKNQLCIQVVDNGIGISEERLKRLGEPFYSNKEKGTGLGLMLCFRIIKEHKGTITFESKENLGTTVKIRLPV
ncbi:PAS domain S-box protein [Bacillus sp. HNG]|uniref:PAS domain-containing sensor histidine kinase n=1 Tax=Bacillus sp. HNG TaxID=2293325 RepID=UPI000E2E733E|nr:ATP-binding protein [Bacillus sp. HNG]RFB15289.1 PAS domain S-box protein [Bacillus sp. HNG]